MKISIFIFLISGALLFLLGCSEDPLSPASNNINQEGETLEKKCVSIFSGTSVSILPPVDPGVVKVLPNGKVLIRNFLINTVDEMDDPRVSGTVNWVVHLNVYPEGNDKRWGTGELEIDGVGKWEMVYKGWKTIDGEVTYIVKGVGKEGLSGLKAKWYYFKPNDQAYFDVKGRIF